MAYCRKGAWHADFRIEGQRLRPPLPEFVETREEAFGRIYQRDK